MPVSAVELSKKWISLHAVPRQTINKRRSSYGLKHAVEKWAGQYIPNGDFIIAAKESGYRATRSNPNAYFNMSFAEKRLERQ